MTLVQTSPTHIYLGDAISYWEMDSSTIAYYPLTSSTTTTDSTGSYNLSNNGSVTFGTHNGVSCAYFPGGYMLYNTSISFGAYPTYTASLRFFMGDNSSRYQTIYEIGQGTRSKMLGTWYNYGVDSGSIALSSWDGGYETVTKKALTINTWHHLVNTVNGTSSKQYLDGEQIATYTNSLSGTQNWLCMGLPNTNNSDYLIGGISNFILESIEWSANNVATYYKQTKSIYS